MQKNDDDFLEMPPLTPEDQRLLDAYVQLGKSVDRLPYSPDIVKLMDLLGLPNSEQQKFQVFQRLLYLRKRGRLPLVGQLAF